MCLNADIDTDELRNSTSAAAHDPNTIPAMPKTPEMLKKQSNVSLAELPTELAPEQKLHTAYKSGATKTGSPDSHNSHADTALVNSRALSPSGHSLAKENGASAVLPPKAGDQAHTRGSAKASEYSAAHADVTAREA